MASMEPSEDEIQQVIEIAGLDPVNDHQMVDRALKNNKRNIETVIMQYFDDPEKFRTQNGTAWDDSLFAADREGQQNQPGISFHIEAPGANEVIRGVTPPPEPYALGAPSRPPSRSNSRSPLGRAINWTANASGAPNSQAEEDEDMQRAIRESAQEAGISMLETGVTETSASQPYFGPANRNDYDQSSWAMVPTGSSETRLTSAPVPSQRKRTDSAPAFLVQGFSSAGDHRLGGLLTILHEIPLARNTLLETGSPAASYGHNGEWWKGQEILPPHVLAELQTGQLTWGEDPRAKPDFDEELHRLMAFLDSTERSYGTISVMTDLIPHSNMGAEKLFYEQLRERNGDTIRPLMNVATLANVQTDDEGSEEAGFGLLEMEYSRSDYTQISTLYESLDQVMWNDVLSWGEIQEVSRMAMFRETGEVFTIKVGGDGPESSFEVPQVLYPERWLETRKEEARRIQGGWCDLNRALVKIQEEKEGLDQVKDTLATGTVRKDEMIKAARDHWKEYGKYLQGLARFHAMERVGFQTDQYPDYRAAPCDMDDDAAKQLKTVEEAIHYSEQVLAYWADTNKGLNSLKEQVEARKQFLGRLLTVPDKPGRPKPMTCKKYLLRGVATSTDVVYVCQRGEVDLIELDRAPQQLDQWWRLAYTPNEEQPVKAEKIEIEQVFGDMWEETKTPLLVYATEEALNTPRAPLSTSLERFVKAENKAFRQELNQEKTETHEKRKSISVDPLSPSKRKHRADSFDSMDSNRASLGSEDERSGFDNPFQNEDDGIEPEMTDLSEHTADFARSASVESPPTVQARRAGSTENTSATMTPSTMVAEVGEHEGSPKTMTAQSDDGKVPEMKERTRSQVMTRSRSATESKKPVDLMDMDIQEN